MNLKEGYEMHGTMKKGSVKVRRELSKKELEKLKRLTRLLRRWWCYQGEMLRRSRES